MAIIPHWLDADERIAGRRVELADRVARFEKHRRLALDELRELQRLIAAQPALAKFLPGGGLTRPRLVVNNKPRQRKLKVIQQ